MPLDQGHNEVTTRSPHLSISSTVMWKFSCGTQCYKGWPCLMHSMKGFQMDVSSCGVVANWQWSAFCSQVGPNSSTHRGRLPSWRATRKLPSNWETPSQHLVDREDDYGEASARLQISSRVKDQHVITYAENHIKIILYAGDNHAVCNVLHFFGQSMVIQGQSFQNLRNTWCFFTIFYLQPMDIHRYSIDVD